jgi:DNA invertase Pin-like site-specific DNA recombinase
VGGRPGSSAQAPRRTLERKGSGAAMGAKSERPGLAKTLAFARRGDTIRRVEVGRSLVHLLESVRALHARRVGFKSLQESIDTTTRSGKLVFHVFGALAECERDITRERDELPGDLPQASYVIQIDVAP